MKIEYILHLKGYPNPSWSAIASFDIKVLQQDLQTLEVTKKYVTTGVYVLEQFYDTLQGMFVYFYISISPSLDLLHVYSTNTTRNKKQNGDIHLEIPCVRTMF